MAIVGFDQSIIATATIRLLRGDIATELLSGGEVITAFPKARWAVSFSIITLTQETRGKAIASMSRLSSLKNTFLLVPPNYSGAIHPGPIAVVGGGQIGTSLNISGQASTTLLRAGEWFGVAGELKMVVEDCVSNETGTATVQFEPSLRKSPRNGAAFNTQNPVAEYRLTNPEAVWSIAQGGYTSMQFDCVEIFND